MSKGVNFDIPDLTNIFPVCENGGIFDCEGNKSNEVLHENCKGILMFTREPETSSCFCRGSNDHIQYSGNIKRQGWTRYVRYYSIQQFL